MKFEFRIDWAWIIRKIHLLLRVAIFLTLYFGFHPGIGFAFAFWILLNDVSDIEVTQADMEEELKEVNTTWKNTWNIRKRI